MVGRKPPPDPRPFVRMSIDLYIHAKLSEISDITTAGWTYVTGMLISKQGQKDGLIQPELVMHHAHTTGRRVRLRGRRMKVSTALIEQNLWHLPGHSCRRCPQPPDGYAIIHDYLRHQQSAEDLQELRATKSRSGKLGADARWEGHTPARAAAKPHAEASAMTDAMADATADALNGAMRTLAQPPPQPQTARRKSTARRAQTVLPDPFPITAAMREWAGTHTPLVTDLETAHARFLSHYRSVGTPRADWGEAWKGWMMGDERNARQRRETANRGNRTVYSNGSDPAAALRAQERSSHG